MRKGGLGWGWGRESQHLECRDEEEARQERTGKEHGKEGCREIAGMEREQGPEGKAEGRS